MRDPCAGHPWSGPPSPVATSACSSSIDCAKTQKRAHPILECYVIFLGSKTPWCRQRDLHKREFPTRVSSPSNGAVTPSSGSNIGFGGIIGNLYWNITFFSLQSITSIEVSFLGIKGLDTGRDIESDRSIGQICLKMCQMRDLTSLTF